MKELNFWFHWDEHLDWIISSSEDILSRKLPESPLTFFFFFWKKKRLFLTEIVKISSKRTDYYRFIFVCLFVLNPTIYSLKIKHLQKAGSAFGGAPILVGDKRLGMKIYHFLWEKYNLPWEQRGGSEKPPRKRVHP